MKTKDHLSNRAQIYSLDDLKTHYRRNTKGHWFDKDTMRFFRSRLSDRLHFGAESIYFVSSEQGPSGVRLYSVRKYTPSSGEIDTVGDFQQYKTSSSAQRAAERAAREERGETK